MANATIDFDGIYAGQKGSEVSQIILENLKKLSARIVELEDQISQIKGSSIDGATVIDNTGSISVQYAPTSVFGKTYSISQVSYVSVKVTYGTTDLYPGTDDSGSHYSYSLTNSDIMSNGKKIGTVESVVEFSNLKFKVTILPNTISDSNFSFTITFKGKTYSYTVPILIMNDDHALNGQSVYTSTVFKRSTGGAPSTPTGGSFDNPIPSGWSDGIPGGNGDLYTSHRTFTSDGQPPQSANWSIPMLAQYSSDIDVCYSAYTVGRPKSPSELGLPHGSQDSDTSIYHWHDSGTENDVWMAISIKAGNEWGDWSVLKIKGENGTNGGWKDVIYKEFDGTSLQAPNIMNPNNFVDLEDSAIRKDDGSVNTEERNKKWKDRPSSSGVWWMSVGAIDGTTNLCQYGWSEPVKVTPGEGVAGAACFMSTVFKRGKAGNISTPIGGSYSSPVPTGWSDGIPADDGSANPIWESHRRFTSDGKTPQDTAWSTPKLIIDTADFDVCYSASPTMPPKPTTHGVQSDTYWHNEGTENDKWMATSSKRSQGDWTDWTITQIKGENGNNGDWMDYVFKQYSGDTLSAPDTHDPTFFDKVNDPTSPYYDPTSVNFGWLDGPGVGSDWWMSCALIDGTTGMLDNHEEGKCWSEPKRLQGDKGADGSYTESQYKVSDNMLNHPVESATWYNNVLDAYHELGDYDYLLPNYYMWIRQRRYDGTTKTWGGYEYMRVTGEKGETGTSIEIKGTVNSYKELFSLTGVSDGDSYILFEHLWNYSTSTTYRYYNDLSEELKHLYNPDDEPNFPNPGYWFDCGQIVGPSGTSQYMHIKYAEMLDCSGTTAEGKVYLYPSAGLVHNEPDTYIGVLVDSNPEAEDDDYSLYTWSQFTGDDGYGYEYIYKLKADSDPWAVPVPPTTCAPYTSETYQTNDYVPEGWTDNPSGITAEMPYEFMCRREKINQIWQPFTGQAKNTSKASLYSYYGKDAPEQIYEYANFTSYVLTDEMKASDLWQRWVIGSTPSGYFLWQRVCTYTPARGNEPAKYTSWQYSRITGERGETGTGLEIQGSMSSYHELFALSDPTEWEKTHSGTYHDPEDGTCYIVFGHLWSWVASSTEIIYDDLSVKEKEAYKAKYGTTLSQRHWQDGGQVQGPQGISGETAYIHVKFANTASYVSGNTYEVTDEEWLTTFATSHDGEAPGRFIGMFTNLEKTDPSGLDKRYIWTKYTGDDGLNYEHIYTRTATDTDVPVPVVSENMLNGTDTSKVKVVQSITPEGVIIETTKAYQESDWVPYTATTSNGAAVTTYNWTDNPMGPTEELPFEWCCKREKSISVSGSTALWGAFYGKANDTTKAFLFNKYGDSALQLDMTNQVHGYKRNASGTCITETVVCKINVSKDGEPRRISSIVVTGDKSQFQLITPSAASKQVTLRNKSSMTSGGTLTFKITIDGEIYDKTFNYTVTDDGTPGLTIYFDPESIVAEEDILSGSVSTANTYAHLNVYQDGNQLKYKSSGTLAADEYSVSITPESIAEITPKIQYSASNDNGRYKFHITNFDVSGTRPYGGTVEFNIVTGGITYKRALKWMVNWLAFFRQTICGDTMTNIAQNVTREIDNRGLLTISSGKSMFVQSSTGIEGKVTKLVGDVENLSGTTGSLQLSADSFSTKIEATDGRFTTIEQGLETLSLKVGQTHGIRPNVIPNSRLNLMSDYYWFNTKEAILNKGDYTLSAKGRVDIGGNQMRVIAYLFDSDWSNNVIFDESVWRVKEKTFTVPNDNTRCSIGVYFTNPDTPFNAPIGSYGYTEWVKLEAGSGATEWCESSLDGTTNNFLKVIPYDVANISSGVTGTRTKITNSNGNYVRIENSSGDGWQLRYKLPNHYVESYVNNGSPKTLYYWLVAKSVNNASTDRISFGSENRKYDFATYHYNPASAVSSTNCPSISLPGGWVMYYKTLNMFNSAFRQRNLLEVYASYKLSVLSVPTSEITLTLTIGEATKTYTIEKNTTITQIAYIINAMPASGFRSKVEGSNIYITSMYNMKHFACSSSHPNIVSITEYKNAWINVSDGVVAQNGQLEYTTSKSPESTTNSFPLGEQIIGGGLKASTWYTLSFVAKNTATTTSTGPIYSFVYFSGASNTNPVGDIGGNTNVYVDVATSTNNDREMNTPTADCNHSWNFTTDFKEYSYSFRTSDKYDTTKEARVLFRINGTGGKPYGVIIKNIKLEQSAGKTGYYNSSGYMSENPEQYIGVNSVMGTWDVLACGISTEGIPSPASINPSLKIASLLDTGIDIENKKVTITADNFLVQDNEGNTQALISGGGISTNWLSANTVTAINARTETLTLNNAKAVDANGKTTVVIDGNSGSLSCNTGTFNDVMLSGSMASPFYDPSYHNIKGNNFNISDGYTITWVDGNTSTYPNDILTWNIGDSGRIIRIGMYAYNGSYAGTGSSTFTAPDGKYFYEYGKRKNTLKLSREIVELIGYSTRTNFLGYIVLNRTDLMTTKSYGRPLKMIAYGKVLLTDVSSKTFNFICKTYDGSTDMKCERLSGEAGQYKISWASEHFADLEHVFVQATPIGYINKVWNATPGTSNNTCAKCTVVNFTQYSFTVEISDDASSKNNEGSFAFVLSNLDDWWI